jgi:hypothetical protein
MPDQNRGDQQTYDQPAAASRWRIKLFVPAGGQSRTLRSRKALPTTETLEKVIAAAAIMGDKSSPKNG